MSKLSEHLAAISAALCTRVDRDCADAKDSDSLTRYPDVSWSAFEVGQQMPTTRVPTYKTVLGL